MCTFALFPSPPFPPLPSLPFPSLSLPPRPLRLCVSPFCTPRRRGRRGYAQRQKPFVSREDEAPCRHKNLRRTKNHFPTNNHMGYLIRVSQAAV